MKLLLEAKKIDRERVVSAAKQVAKEMKALLTGHYAPSPVKDASEFDEYILVELFTADNMLDFFVIFEPEKTKVDVILDQVFFKGQEGKGLGSALISSIAEAMSKEGLKYRVCLYDFSNTLDDGGTVWTHIFTKFPNVDVVYGDRS